MFNQPTQAARQANKQLVITFAQEDTRSAVLNMYFIELGAVCNTYNYQIQYLNHKKIILLQLRLKLKN